MIILPLTDLQSEVEQKLKAEKRVSELEEELKNLKGKLKEEKERLQNTEKSLHKLQKLECPPPSKDSKADQVD